MLALRRSESASQAEGICFNAVFEKTRSKSGNAVQNFHATFRDDNGLGLGSWTRSALRVESSNNEILTLLASGMKQAQIAKKLKIDPSNVSRAVTKARTQGQLRDSDGAAETFADEDGTCQ